MNRIESNRLLLRCPEAGDQTELEMVFCNPFMMRYLGGLWTSELVAEAIEEWRGDWGAIGPDGSYLVNDNGDGSLRVRFRLADGTWSAPKDLTKQGIPASAAIASTSPDGKYLFYTDKGDLYWVSADVIKSLK